MGEALERCDIGAKMSDTYSACNAGVRNCTI